MEQAVNTKTSAQTFEELLAGSVAAHGHLCPARSWGCAWPSWACGSWVSRPRRRIPN